jgi:hypothetical protein
LTDTAVSREIRVRRSYQDGEVMVRGVVDVDGRTITIELRDGTRVVVDAETARALQMLLYESVYGVLGPTGPSLRVE